LTERSVKAQNAVNPDGFTSILTRNERKSAFLKRCSDYSLYPTECKICGTDLSVPYGQGILIYIQHRTP